MAARVLPIAVLSSGAGSSPRPLSSIVLPVLRGPEEVSLGGLVSAQVLANLALHPAVPGWLSAAGWLVSEPRPGVILASLPRSPLELSVPALAPLRPLLSEGALSALLRRAERQVLQFEMFGLAGTLRISPGRLEFRSPPRPIGGPALLDLLTTDDVVLAGESSWFGFDSLRRSALVVLPDPTNPVRALSVPPGSQLPVQESAAAALARVEDSHLHTPVALSPQVLDVAAVAAAGPADRPGLFPQQDALVSALLASETGVVLAAPPGSGKTVIVASALGELGRSGVLVTAPPGLLQQWVDELARWAPHLSVVVARDAASLRRGLGSRDVVLASHQVAAGWGTTSRTRFGVLVVDEAAALLRRSRTGAGLFRLRRLADIAWPLTGSPGERGGAGGVSRLVEFARSLPEGSIPALAPAEFAPLVLDPGQDSGVPRLRVYKVPYESHRAYGAEIGAKLLEFSSSSGLQRTNLLASVRSAAATAILDAESSGNGSVLSEILLYSSSDRPTLLFTQSTGLAASWEALVRSRGVEARCLPLAGDRSGRVRVLSAFAEGSLPVLILTPASQRGVNLQRAGVVVHLDLPLSAAEFEQRNGRAARLGSPHDEVAVMLPYPDEPALRPWVDGLLEGGGFSAAGL